MITVEDLNTNQPFFLFSAFFIDTRIIKLSSPTERNVFKGGLKCPKTLCPKILFNDDVRENCPNFSKDGDPEIVLESISAAKLGPKNYDSATFSVLQCLFCSAAMVS